MKKLFLIFIILLNVNSVFADTVDFDPNTPIACDDAPSKLYSLYNANQYTCSSGYYLPAHVDGCIACPSVGVCNGGNFEYKPNEFQGLILNETLSPSTMPKVCADNFPSKIYAEYTPNEHTCSSGYYLPKNVDGCTACPNGYTCAGGTFTFNETTDQGIVANTITIVWNGASAEDIAANNAGTTVYGGDIRTPRAAIPIPGKIFRGWRFSKPTQN